MRERTMLEDRLGAFDRRWSAISTTRRPWSNSARWKAIRPTEQEGLGVLKGLKAEGERRQIEALLSGEADANDTYVEVHSGAGGTESCDWARMLLRMYMRWAERRDFEVEIVEETDGDEAGIKSATLASRAITRMAG